jgi:hypothetical protein
MKLFTGMLAEMYPRRSHLGDVSVVVLQAFTLWRQRFSFSCHTWIGFDTNEQEELYKEPGEEPAAIFFVRSIAKIGVHDCVWKAAAADQLAVFVVAALSRLAARLPLCLVDCLAASCRPGLARQCHRIIGHDDVDDGAG